MSKDKPDLADTGDKQSWYELAREAVDNLGRIAIALEVIKKANPRVGKDGEM